MPNTLKGLVSKKKIRFKKDGFDLDLTYITNRIIAMGYPAQSLEGIYRNHIDDVVNFFKKRHEKHYQIFNLCNERHIDEQKFEPDSINHSYPFDDHNPPKFSKMIKCCEDILLYLNRDERNIVAVQCKAGKGRTGVIVCSCLLLMAHSANATEALQFYGKARTTNGKGVTIPSQIRYIYYYDHMLQNQLTYMDTALKFNHLVLEELPNVAGNVFEIQIIVYRFDKDEKLSECHSSQFYEVKKDSQRSLILYPDDEWILAGDLKFQVVSKSKFGKKENLCHCWINTFFVAHKPPILYLDDKSSSNKLDVHINSMRRTARTASDGSERTRGHVSPTHDTVTPTHDTVSTTHDTVSYKFTFVKQEIDKANKDVNNKNFPSHFAMTFFFEASSSSSSSSDPPVDTSSPHDQLTSHEEVDSPSYRIAQKNDIKCHGASLKRHGASVKDHRVDYNVYDESESSESSTNPGSSDVE